MFPTSVGIAIFDQPRFPPKWVLVLAKNAQFKGRVLCSTIQHGVNGFIAQWKMCDHTPSLFDRTAMFIGVIHVATIPTPVDVLRNELCSASESVPLFQNPYKYGTDLYCIRSLIHLCKRHPTLDKLDEYQLTHLIQRRASTLQAARQPPASRSYPIVSLDGGNVHIIDGPPVPVDAPHSCY